VRGQKLTALSCWHTALTGTHSAVGHPCLPGLASPDAKALPRARTGRTAITREQAIAIGL
jgi:hypothetical protein